MSSTARDHRAEFIKWLEWYDKTKSADANDPLVARFALQGVNEIHLMMPGRSDRAEAVRIMHEFIGGPVFTGSSEEKTGELYDQLRKDANIWPAS